MPRYRVLGGITHHQTVQGLDAENAAESGREEAVRGFCDYYGGSVSEREVDVLDDVLDLDQPFGDGGLFVLTTAYSTVVTVEADDEEEAEESAYAAIAAELEGDLDLQGISHSDVAVWQVELLEEEL